MIDKTGRRSSSHAADLISYQETPPHRRIPDGVGEYPADSVARKTIKP
jgi:hypothetical protein